MANQSLFPDNRTSLDVVLERAIEDALKSEDVYAWLRDPDKTRPDLLDIMAKEEGVQDWYSSDLESDKRKSIKNAVNIHRKAGTRLGVEEALEALGCVATVTRSIDEKYHLNISNLVTDKVLTEKLLDRLYERVINTKAERDSFSLTVGRAIDGEVFHSVQVSIGRRIKIEAA